MTMYVTSAEATIHRYYDALREGEPLHPFFADEGRVVKIGIGERLVGADEVASGLRQQTETTEGWDVESRDPHISVGGHRGTDHQAGEVTADDDDFAWFDDEVFLAWTDTERDIRFEFETRWTGTMCRRDEGWQFVMMHVSSPGQT